MTPPSSPAGRRPRLPLPCLLAGLLLLALAGCDEYEVVLRPAGDRLQRSVTYRRTDNRESVPPEIVDRLVAAHGLAAVTIAGGTATASGEFGRQPADLGGVGQFQSVHGHLGNVCLYIERLAGDDDLAGHLERQLAAADRLVELLRRHLADRLANQPEWPRLEAFLRDQAPGDLKNAVLRLTVGQIADQLPGYRAEKKDPAVGAIHEAIAAGLFRLHERGYFQAEDLPAILAMLNDAEHGWRRLLELALARIFVPPLPAELHAALIEAVGDPEHLAAELNRLAGARLDPGQPTAAEPEQPVERLLEQLAGGPLLGGNGHGLKLTLHCPVPPLYTNGHWQAGASNPEAGGTVIWNQAFGTCQTPPRQAFAIWVEADHAALARIFGHSTPEPATLLELITLEQALTPPTRQTYTAAMAKVDHPEQLAAALANLEQTLRQRDNAAEDRPTLEAIIARCRQLAAPAN